ncbi:Dephospho-CoA kinase [Flavobacterium cauense R2A-7]|uniref:Dephospho-CoA kinase n=1 Tax=Flavobacterium cauense R2A-7 TaxID=1341154 RepID=V6S4I0_9FLAO|nr:dephospho-CoA kinase [Flavobacterium cauense]ESU19280.1 Dephospho-CoA kinase [Flavobacterium cauense R2A-7]KGO82103.1 dephospho-CoA kinase [Flavobacterium cauense R2A-7]TWI15051.1 dephospho-CoA kinase [Flavobacterium cauense R2A-7]
MTKIIGLTGGIGSGKSTIAGYFKALGVPVYIADDEAKKLMNNPETVKKVQSVFEENVIENHVLDRKKIATLVFSNPKKLEQLNSVVHPEVKKHFLTWLKIHKNEPFIVKEAAILFESGSYKDCDKIIMVTAPEAVRIERVMQRDKVTKAQVLERMQNQWPEEEKIKRSDFVIENIDLKESEKKVTEILKELNNL